MYIYIYIYIYIYVCIYICIKRQRFSNKEQLICNLKVHTDTAAIFSKMVLFI